MQRVLSQGFGNYVIAKEVVGTWDFESSSGFSKRRHRKRYLWQKSWHTRCFQGAEIGTARVRGLPYHSGMAHSMVSFFYLFDVQMNTGKSFSQVRGIYENNSSGPKSMADIVLEGTPAVAKLKEQGLNTCLPVHSEGHKATYNSAGTVDTQFVFRTEKTVTFTGGSATVSANSAHAGGTETLNETGSLTNTEERNVIVVAKAEATTDAHTGKVSAISGNTITGTGTAFTTAYQVGDFIRITDGSNTYNERITAVTNNTSLKVANTIAVTRSSVSLSHRTLFPTGYIFDLSGLTERFHLLLRHTQSITASESIVILGFCILQCS